MGMKVIINKLLRKPPGWPIDAVTLSLILLLPLLLAIVIGAVLPWIALLLAR